MSEEYKSPSNTLRQYGYLWLAALGVCTALGFVGKALDKYETKMNMLEYKNIELTTIIEIYKQDEKTLSKKYNSILPENIKLQDANKDGLQDLIYKSGTIYFQTKDSTFATLNEILESEKEKVNAKSDSIRNVILKATIDDVNKKYSNKVKHDDK